MKLRDVEVKGVTVAVEVRPNGSFAADLGEHGVITADTFDGLIEKLTRAMATKKAAINIPVIFKAFGKVERGSFTGIHAATGNMLLKVDGKKGGEQITKWTSTMYLSPEREPEYSLLVAAEAQARKAVEEFEKTHKLQIAQLLNEALEKITTAA